MSEQRPSKRPARGLILGIETSCDETAAAVVARGDDVLSSVVSSQVDLHARFGGVVPEIASRAHLELLVPVVAQAMVEAGVTGADLDAVAVTHGPGLIGALLVGLSGAKGLALAWDLPLVGVNHLEAHLYAAQLEHGPIEFPQMVLLVSGGHTQLVAVSAPGDYELVGATLDDAAGEAFDKVARFLALGYPGGPAVEEVARSGDPQAIAFPRAMVNDGFNFSFSGLKTAVINHVRRYPDAGTEDVAASFQAAAVDVLALKLARAASEYGAASVALAGGVAANSPLRERVALDAELAGLGCSLPGRAYCTDNAAMVAAAGWYRFQSDGPSNLDLPAVPGLRLPGRARPEPGAPVTDRD